LDEHGASKDDLVAGLSNMYQVARENLGDFAAQMSKVMLELPEICRKVAEQSSEIPTVPRAGAGGVPEEKDVDERAVELAALHAALVAYLLVVESKGVRYANLGSGAVFERVRAIGPGLFDLLAEAREMKPHEFVASLVKAETLFYPRRRASSRARQSPGVCVEHRRGYELMEITHQINLAGGKAYAELVLLALMLDRKDIISKGAHFRLACEATVNAIGHRYIELGGTQDVMEHTAMDYLESGVGEVMRAAPLDGEAARRAEAMLGKLGPLLDKFQQEAGKELEEAHRLDRLSRPVDLDAEVGEQGEGSTLADLIPGEPDVAEARLQLKEICDSLEPEDADLFIERFIEGKSIQEIATERRWEYDRTQKRLERMKKRIIDEMSG
jgi:hypothetical protein